MHAHVQNVGRVTCHTADEPRCTGHTHQREQARGGRGRVGRGSCEAVFQFFVYAESCGGIGHLAQKGGGKLNSRGDELSSDKPRVLMVDNGSWWSQNIPRCTTRGTQCSSRYVQRCRSWSSAHQARVFVTEPRNADGLNVSECVATKIRRCDVVSDTSPGGGL